MKYTTAMIMSKKDMDRLYDAITQLQNTILELMESVNVVDNGRTAIYLDVIESETADCRNFLRSGITMTGASLSMLSDVLYDIYHKCHKVTKDAAVSDDKKKKIKENVEEIRNLFILD